MCEQRRRESRAPREMHCEESLKFQDFFCGEIVPKLRIACHICTIGAMMPGEIGPGLSFVKL